MLTRTLPLLFFFGTLISVYSRPAPANPPGHCFTCRMDVLTPEGYRRINALREGDEVLSWDNVGRKLVRNRILAIHRTESVAFGELIEHHKRGPFEVTPDHPFYLPRLRTAYPLSDIPSDEKLLYVIGDDVSCAASLRDKGAFIYRGTDHVMSLTLEGQPDNFLVNGIVVKNTPPSSGRPE